MKSFAPPEPLAQLRDDGLAIRRVLATLLLVETDDLAPIPDVHVLDLQRRRVLRALTFGLDLAKAPRVGEDLVANLQRRAHPRAQNVVAIQLPGLQCGDGLGTDHAPIRDDGDFADPKALPQMTDDRQEGGDICDVAGPQFATEGTASRSSTIPTSICLRSGR